MDRPTIRGLGLRRGVRLAYVVLAVLLVVGVTLNVGTFRGVLHERRRLSDRLDPARLAAQGWLGAVISQETGVRGFALTGESEFLQPRTDGLRRAAADERQVRELLQAEPDLLRLVDRFDGEIASWRENVADARVARIRAAGVGSIGEAQLREGQAAFDRIRIRFSRLEGALRTERLASRDQLSRRNRELEATSVLAVLLFGISVAATWSVLHRKVLRPLEQLGDDARQVAGGDLRHRIEPAGPPELVFLAGDMEAMRGRIIAELEIVENARTQLMEQAHDLERSNQELEQFAYVASHDLQEPLRKVTGFCQLLQRRYADQLDERAEEYIQFAVDGAKRMQVLINDLLAFSRVGRTTTAFVPVDVGVLARTAVDTLSEMIDETHATFEIGALPTVTGDPTLLAGLVQNLLANAIKFHGDDPPHITVGSHDGPDEWTISVADNGIGIAPEYAEQIFVIFQRLHTRDVYEGTGIGLAMCRKIVEFHGGRIWVATDDEHRAGATICFTLPHEPPTITSPIAIDTAAATPSSRGDQP